MLKLRKFLCGSFGILAISFGMIGYDSVKAIWNNGLMPPVNQNITAILPQSLTVALPFIASLLMIMPLPLAILYGMAWWTSAAKKPSARTWALTASFALLIFGIPPLALSTYIASSHNHGQLRNVLIGLVPLLLLSPGIAGTIAFARKDALQPAIIAPPRQLRIGGDGTNLFGDILFLVLSGVGILVAQDSWFHWAQTNNVRFFGSLAFCVSFAAALLANVVVHEWGHALAGWALGMRLRTFIVGPFEWQMRGDKWKFKIDFKKAFSFDGATGVVPTDPKQSRRDYVSMIAAGSIASLMLGLVALSLAFSVPGTAFEWAWEKTDPSDSELYWMAKCALEMGEGDLLIANEAWEKGNAIAQKRPKAGSYDCNRDCFAELGEALKRDKNREFANTAP